MSPRTATWPRSSTRVDAHVAGGDERLDEVVAVERVAACDRDRLGPRVERGHALGERLGRDRDEPAVVQQVEAARALADEVRRRVESRAVGDAARGQVADGLLGGRYQAAASASSRADSSSSTSTASARRGASARRLQSAAATTAAAAPRPARPRSGGRAPPTAPRARRARRGRRRAGRRTRRACSRRRRGYDRG